MNFSTLQKRFFAWGMSKANRAKVRDVRITDLSEYSNLSQLKQALLGSLEGKILEIGAGAGANFAYYPKTVSWLGIEPNSFMHPYLQQEAENRGFTEIELHQGTAEKLPVEDNSIDVVVSTHVLCSVEDLTASLQEIKRVLKPGGKFIFIEHVAAECGTWMRTIQNGIEPIWQAIFDNCHPNRESGKALEKVGFAEVSYRQFQLSFPIVSPHIAGVALKSR
jgi:ubiquinone/menaquinone biosynthesis C-methylase UbiE